MSGYTYAAPEGYLGYIETKVSPWRTGWLTTPTKDDILGVDQSAVPLPQINFDISNTETSHRNRVIAMGYNRGINLADLVQGLPENYLTEHLNNIVFSRPLVTLDDMPVRINDVFQVNPYVLAPCYFIRYLLLSMSQELLSNDLYSYQQRGTALGTLASQVQYTIDLILSKYDIDALSDNIVLGAKVISTTNDSGAITNKKTTLFLAETAYNAWLASGGTDELVVANYVVNAADATDATITNSATILASWHNMQG